MYSCNKSILILVILFCFISCTDILHKKNKKDEVKKLKVIEALSRKVLIHLEIPENTDAKYFYFEVNGKFLIKSHRIKNSDTKDTLLAQRIGRYLPGKDHTEFFDWNRSIDRVGDLVDFRFKPDQDYTIRGLFQTENDGEFIDSTNYAEFHTFPLTSNHAFWKVDTFGSSDYKYSRLYDVDIISKNNIWTVGSVVLDDYASPRGVKRYTTFHWKKINTYEYDWCPSNDLVDYAPEVTWKEAGGVGAYDDNHIFTAGYGDIYYYNGNETVTLWDEGPWPDEGRISNDIYAIDTNNVYFCGIKGWIVHWDGQSITRIPASEDEDFHNIDVFEKTGEVYILSQKAIYKIEEDELVPFLEADDFAKNCSITSFDIHEDIFYIVTSDGFYKYFTEYDILYLEESAVGVMYPFYDTFVFNKNNIYFIGPWGLLSHFNGDKYSLEKQLFEDPYFTWDKGVDCIEDMAVIVGSYQGKAFVARVLY